MQKVKRLTLQWLPLVLWMAIIFVVSHQPSDAIPRYGTWDVLLKKGGHLVAYAILAVLARHAGLSHRASLILALLYAITDELHQRFIPGRTGRPLDVMIDFVGALMGVAVYRLSGRWRRGFRSDRTGVVAGQSPRDA